MEDKKNINNQNNQNNENTNDVEKNDTKNISIIGKDANTILAKNNTNTGNTTTNTTINNTDNTGNSGNTGNTGNANNNNTKKRLPKANNNLTKKNNITDTEDNSTSENTPIANTELNTTNTDEKVSKDKLLNLNKLTMNLLNHQIVLKLFHFQTELYGAHKASDAYLEKYAQTMDKFLEIAQGIYGKITLKKYTLTGSSHTDENIIKHLDGMITLLREKIDDILDNYTDLTNVRDEMAGDLEQLKYLLSFK